MKVLILIATYNQGNLLWDCLRHLSKLDPQPDKYIFFENNSTDNTLDVINRFPYPKELTRMWFKSDALTTPYDGIGIARQYLLKRARQLKADFAIFIDSDIMILEKDLISRMTQHKKDIVGAPYLRSFRDGMFLASKWEREGSDRLWYKSSCAGFQECYVTSAGCLCLSKKIIQDRRVNFLPIVWNEKKYSEDFGYCHKAHDVGYKVYIDCTLRVGHYAQASDYKAWMIEDGEYIDFHY